MTPASRTRIRWLDCAKAVAILAVVVDHCGTLLYDNAFLAQASSFSVSLFILLSGVSVWISSHQGKDISFAKQCRRVGRLLVSYTAATFVMVTVLNGSFDLTVFLDRLIHFNAMQTLYYLFVLFQLMLAAPWLVKWCAFCDGRRCPALWLLGGLLLLLLTAMFCEHRTYMLPLHGGGKYLFGATYLPLYYLGIALASRKAFWQRLRIGSPYGLVLSFGLWAAGAFFPLTGCAPRGSRKR